MLLLIERSRKGVENNEAEVMIGQEGFVQRRAAQTNTRGLYQAVKEFKISSIECVERKFQEERAGRRRG